MSAPRRRNASLAASLAAVAAGMLMLAYAASPLYRLFCEATGFGGTPRRAEAVSRQAAGRSLLIRFNADTDPALPWEFSPESPSIKARIGENVLAAYVARNRSGRPATGHATYNVVPEKAGAYFMKVECFCFQDQTLAGGQEAHMPISFYIDPALADDPLMNDVQTITLSYTFFAAKKR